MWWYVKGISEAMPVVQQWRCNVIWDGWKISNLFEFTSQRSHVTGSWYEYTFVHSAWVQPFPLCWVPVVYRLGSHSSLALVLAGFVYTLIVTCSVLFLSYSYLFYPLYLTFTRITLCTWCYPGLLTLSIGHLSCLRTAILLLENPVDLITKFITLKVIRYLWLFQKYPSWIKTWSLKKN